MQTYIKYCWKCREFSQHKVKKKYRRRGFTLQCLRCGRFVLRFIDEKKLIPYVVNEMEIKQ